jgi:hypothetical protein
VKDWNVIVSIYQGGFRRALHALEKLGPTERSPYHNVIVMKVDNPIALLDAVERKTEESPALYDAISRVAPAMHNFEFQSADEFKEKAGSVLHEWSQRLAGARSTCACIAEARDTPCGRPTSSATSMMRSSTRCRKPARPASCRSRIPMR